MTKTIIVVILVFLSVEVANADKFQLIERGSGSYIAYSPVYSEGKLIGYTDKYGRISINYRNGRYTFQVFYESRKMPASVVIDGSPYLKRVYIPLQ